MHARRDRAERLWDVARLAAREPAARLAREREGAILAAGHDLVCIPEFAPLLRPRFIERAFTPAEAADAAGSFDPRVYFAARWAAKEAAYKCFCQLAEKLGLPQDGLACFRNYEVAAGVGSAIPRLVFHERPARLIEELARERDVEVSLSLTHERDYAAAFVVAVAVPRVGSGCAPQDRNLWRRFDP